MFDAGTAALIRAAPAVEGIEPENLPQDLTKAYVELVALRLRLGAPDADASRQLNLERLLRIATVYEAVTDLAQVPDERRAAAFVAATTYQIVGQVGPTENVTTRELLGTAAIHPLIAAPLLFLIAGQSPDAREAGRRLKGLEADNLLLTALIETISDLSDERFEDILRRSVRLAEVRSNSAAGLETQATQALYGLCWSGLVQLVAEVLDEPAPESAFRRFERPQEAFAQVERLSLADLDIPGEGAILVTSFTGPRHLARLLRLVADWMTGSGLATLPTPAGANAEVWRPWIRNRARTKPLVWPNHKPAIQGGLLEFGRSAVMVLPTGAGKTTVSELKIAATLAGGRKVVFLVPTLALVDQLRDDLARSFPADLGDIAVSTDGDLTVLATGPELSKIEVMTPERMLALLSFADADVSEVGLIIFDECHILSHLGGGTRSVDAMLCLLHSVKRAPQADLLLLSAMLTNGEEMAAWLTQLTGRPASYFFDPWKPSRQARGVVVYPQAELDPIIAYARAKRRGLPLPKPPIAATAHGLFGLQNNWNPAARRDTSLVRLSTEPVTISVGKLGPTANANKVAAAIAERSAVRGLKTIVFVQQADHACSTAKSMASNLPRNGDLTQTELVLRSATETELGPMGLSLIEPTAGALPHNGDMLPAERRLAESLFQRSDGAKVIVATPTLAQGMNLPAQMAILAGDVRSDAKGRTDLKQHELLNAAGRAGRAGHLANGLVLLIPEPVVGFSALGLASAQSLEKLRSILPPNDQCVRIDDPLADLLDRIQAGAHAEPDVRYFMSRIRAGEPAEVANDVAVSLVQRSLAAFQARARHDEEVFAEKVVVLQLALAAEVESFDADAIRISAFTGMSAAALQAVSARLERELDNLPSTIAGWCDWLVDFLSTDPDAFVALLMNDADVINTITRGKKAGGPTAPEEFARLKAGLRAWVEGRPFDEIEIALGGPPGIASTCKRARDLTLKLANRRFSMIAAALAELAKLRLAAVGRQSENPAVLEIFAIAMRRGFDSAEKVAFAHRNPTIRTRVSLHRAFEKRMGAFTPLLGHSFRDVLSQVDLRMAFGAGDSDGA